MAIVTPIRDRLCYPAGYMPRIDPTHPAVRASGKFLRFSGVASGNNFIRIDKLPVKGTVSGTITGGIHGVIGPYVKNLGTTASINFAGNSTVAATSCTQAAIAITVAAAITQFFCATSTATANVPTLAMDAGTNQLSLAALTGAPNILSGIVLTAGVPYFLAASYPVNATGFVNFAVTNLLTGQITQTRVANTFTSVASSGTYCVCGDNGIDTCNQSVAAAMYSTAGLNPSDMFAWAGDPWAFWYPDIATMDDFLVGSSFIPPSATPLGASLMPMMGVG